MRDIVDNEKKMREINRKTARESNTSMWLLSAEFTAASRYETDTDSEARIDAFAEGAAWAMEHLPSVNEDILRILRQEHVEHAQDVWENIRKAIQQHILTRQTE